MYAVGSPNILTATTALCSESFMSALSLYSIMRTFIRACPLLVCILREPVDVPWFSTNLASQTTSKTTKYEKG